LSGKLEIGEDNRSTTLRRAWDLSLHLLSTKVNTVAFESFLRSVQPLSIEDGVVSLGVYSSYQKNRLEKTHYNAIRSALEFHLDTTGLKIEFSVLTNEQRATAVRGRSGKRPDPSQTTLQLDGEAALL
jgi:chromosomal replication initiator protein